MSPEPEPMTADLEAIAERLDAERPIPRAGFRGELRRRVLRSPRTHEARPRRLQLLITAYASSGLALLAVAAIGLAGAGPFAAG